MTVSFASHRWSHLWSSSYTIPGGNVPARRERSADLDIGLFVLNAATHRGEYRFDLQISL